MRVSLNLATRPFVELRPLFGKLRLIVIGLALLAIALGLALRSLNAKASAAEAEMNALKVKTLQFQQDRQHNEARMRQPQNLAVLERSQFLNALFVSKSFSWTAVMMDLEHVLPAGVQVTSIEPATAKTGEVTIRLRVSGDRDHAVQLVRNLERSQRFINPRLAGEQTQAQAQETGRAMTPGTVPGAVEFDILSGYNPLPPQELKAEKKSSAEEKTALSSSDKPLAPATRRTRDLKTAPPSARQKLGGVQ